jgi:hypothetical protein
VQCNNIRIQNGQRIIAASSFSKAISKWNKEHSNAKTLGALIQELHAKMGCLPMLAQCNDVRLQNGQRSSTSSTYAKEIKKWNLQHASSQSEHAESMSSIGDEESDDIVSAEVQKWVHDLTHSAAERGIRKEGHIKPINGAVKERVQRDIDEYLESNSRKMSTCACCDELCRPKDTHDVSLNRRFCKRLHWTSDIPDAIRANSQNFGASHSGGALYPCMSTSVLFPLFFLFIPYYSSDFFFTVDRLENAKIFSTA